MFGSIRLPPDAVSARTRPRDARNCRTCPRGHRTHRPLTTPSLPSSARDRHPIARVDRTDSASETPVAEKDASAEDAPRALERTQSLHGRRDIHGGERPDPGRTLRQSSRSTTSARSAWGFDSSAYSRTSNMKAKRRRIRCVAALNDMTREELVDVYFFRDHRTYQVQPDDLRRAHDLLRGAGCPLAAAIRLRESVPRSYSHRVTAIVADWQDERKPTRALRRTTGRRLSRAGRRG